MILAGQGVTISRAEKLLVELAEKARIPVATTLLGLSVMPSGHPLYKGMVGMHGNIGPNMATNKADLIIGIGMRFDDRVTGIASAYAPDARIIHIDIDASEFDKVVPAAIALHGDASRAIEALMSLIEPVEERSSWLSLFDKCMKCEENAVMQRELYRTGNSPMTMGEVARAVSEATGHEAIAVTDVGQNQMMCARYFCFTRPRSFISSGGLGTMGFGLPAAIGAKISCPDRTVVAFLGDGGFQMTMQELGTIMQYGINVKIVVLNNNYLGNVRQWQNLFYHRRFSQTPMCNPDFISIAHAYGIGGMDVNDRSQLKDAVGQMLGHEGAFVLNVAIDPEDMVFPMVAPGKAVDNILIAPDTVFEL